MFPSFRPKHLQSFRWLGILACLVGLGCTHTLQQPPVKSLTAAQQQQYNETMTKVDEKQKSYEESQRAKRCEGDHPPVQCSKAWPITSTVAGTTVAPTISLEASIGGPTVTADFQHTRNEQSRYVDENYDALIQEMAQGKGDTLRGLYELICPDQIRGVWQTQNFPDRYAAFGSVVQLDFDGLVPLQRNPDKLVTNIRGELGQHHKFVACRYR